MIVLSGTQTSLCQSYPHLMQHMSFIAVDFHEIDEPKQEVEENVGMVAAHPAIHGGWRFKAFPFHQIEMDLGNLAISNR